MGFRVQEGMQLVCQPCWVEGSVLGLAIGKFGGLVLSIPDCVLGGATSFLFAAGELIRPSV